MDMWETLTRARSALKGSPVFDPRSVFGERQGKAVIFPTGLGSALAKAVREGYLSVASEGTSRRGRKYAFTERGLRVIP